MPGSFSVQITITKMDHKWWIKSPWKGEDSIALWICNYSPQHTARRDFVFKNCIKCQSHWVWWTLKAPHPSRDHAVRLWYNKGRVVSLQVLQIQTQLPDFKNLPSLTHRNLILGRNKTKTNIHSGTSAERATPRPLVSELFPSLPIPPPSSRDQGTTRHTGGIHLLKPIPLHTRIFVRPQFDQIRQFNLQCLTLLL